MPYTVTITTEARDGGKPVFLRKFTRYARNLPAAERIAREENRQPTGDPNLFSSDWSVPFPHLNMDQTPIRTWATIAPLHLED